MYDDVKHVMGKEYVTKHVTTKMRRRPFRAKVNNAWMNFMVISKVDKNFLTRDMIKLKQKVSHLIVSVTGNRQNNVPYQDIYGEVLGAVHDKFVHEMGE